MILPLICAALAAFFGIGMFVEMYEERGFPTYTAPRFIIFSLFAAIFLCLA